MAWPSLTISGRYMRAGSLTGCANLEVAGTGCQRLDASCQIVSLVARAAFDALENGSAALAHQLLRALFVAGQLGDDPIRDRSGIILRHLLRGSKSSF